MTPTDQFDTRNYDFFKTAVVAVLALVIIILLIQANEAPPAAALLPASLPTATDLPTPPPAATDTPTPPHVALPVMDTPQLAEDSTLTLSGAGQPGATLQMVANDAPFAMVQVNNDGLWSFAGRLDPGDYSLMVRTLDARGVIVNQSEALALVVPEPPKPIAVPKLGLPRLSQSGALALVGTAEPGAILEVLANGVKLGAATASADGAWAFDGQLAPGDYELIVRAMDADGVEVNQSQPVVVKVLAPPVTIELPDEAPASGGQWTVSGAGLPGSLVTVLIDDEPIGEATVDAGGTWRMTFDLPSAGEHTIAAQMTGADGRVLSAAEATALTVEPALPTFDVAVAEGGITVNGTSEPRADIAVVVDGDVLGITQADANGNWLFSGALAAGSYRVAARALTTNGAAANATEAVPVQVEGGAIEPAGAADDSGATAGQSAPAGQTYIVQDDDWLSKIALLFFGDAAAYSRIIAATNLKSAEDPSFPAIANPDAIEVGWKLWIPSVAWNP